MKIKSDTTIAAMQLRNNAKKAKARSTLFIYLKKYFHYVVKLIL